MKRNEAATDVTCIVGLLDSGKVHIGSDSATSNGHWITQNKNPKVFLNGGYLFGFTTSWRMGQMLQHRLVPPKPQPGQDLTQFMCTVFIDAVRKTFKESGWELKEESGSHKGAERGGNFLVGYKGRLFEIESDFQVAEYPCGYAACGSGYQFALGSLATSAGMKQPPRARILAALKAASRFAVGVTPPFQIKAI